MLPIIMFAVVFLSGMYILTQLEKDIDERTKNNGQVKSRRNSIL